MIFTAKIILLCAGIFLAIATGITFKIEETTPNYGLQATFLAGAIILIFLGGFLR